MELDEKQVKSFQEEILQWYIENKRDLPWRKSRDPYNILVSEIMLQQTQVSRVIPKFEIWMQQFATLEILSKASTRDVLFYWSGLGYNRRALYLQKSAQEVVRRHHGEFPQEERKLRKLSGVGEYTARALLCFAFNKQIAVVDTNVRKIILTKFKDKVIDDPKIIQSIADQLLPKGKAYEWNQALMDYSSALLKNKKIFIPKQSKFKDSDRYYRGEIVRVLLKRGELSFKDMSLHFQDLEKRITEERLEKVITNMIKDTLIYKKRNKFSLPTN